MPHLPWQARLFTQVAVLLLAALQLILVGARAGGDIGGSWAVIFVPAWIAYGVVFLYWIAWLVLAYDSPDYRGGHVIFTDAAPERGVQHGGAHAAAELLSTAALLSANILLVVHLTAASVTPLSVVVPLILLLAFATIAVTLGTMWHHGALTGAA